MAKNRMTVKMKNRELKRQGFFQRYLGIATPPNYDKYIKNKLIQAVVSLEKFDQELINRKDGNEADNYLKEVAEKLNRLGLLPDSDLFQVNNITYKANPRYMKAKDKRMEKGTGGTGDKYH